MVLVSQKYQQNLFCNSLAEVIGFIPSNQASKGNIYENFESGKFLMVYYWSVLI
jgi:hypothetical protein